MCQPSLSNRQFAQALEAHLGGLQRTTVEALAAALDEFNRDRHGFIKAYLPKIASGGQATGTWYHDEFITSREDPGACTVCRGADTVRMQYQCGGCGAPVCDGCITNGDLCPLCAHDLKEDRAND